MGKSGYQCARSDITQRRVRFSRARGQPKTEGHADTGYLQNGGVLCELGMRVALIDWVATSISRSLRGQMGCEELRHVWPRKCEFLYIPLARNRIHCMACFSLWQVFATMPGDNTLMKIIDKELMGMGFQEPAETVRWLSLFVVETVTKLNFYQEHDVGCLMGKGKYYRSWYWNNMSLRYVRDVL